MRTRPYTLPEVQAMHERALARQSPEALAAAGADLGAVAAAAAMQHQLDGRLETLPTDGLEVISSLDTRQEFEAAFESTASLYDRIGLDTPTPEQLAGSGVDFAHLASEYERMTSEGLEPMVVIALQDLELDEAKDLYSQLRQDKTIPNNPLQDQENGDGLDVGSVVAANWSTLTAYVPDRPDGTETPVYENHGPGGTTPVRLWTIRLIPSTSRSTEVNVDYNHNNAIHSTIPEYLTLQASRIQNGQPTVDSDTYSWLQGTFQGDQRAPCGRWFGGTGRVVVGWYVSGGRVGSLGSRLPVW